MRKLLFVLLLVSLSFAVAERFAVEFTPEHPQGRRLDVSSSSTYESEPMFRTMDGEIDTVVLQYDNSSVAGPYGVTSGDVQANRFQCEHPCSIYAIQVYMTDGFGTLQLHAWHDFGGEPDIARDMMFPIEIPASIYSGWKTVNLEDEIGGKLYVPPLMDFHVGIQHYAAMPNIHYSTNDVGSPVAHLYVASEDTWYILGSSSDHYAYKIRLHGIYFDQDTSKSFTNIAEEAGLTAGGRTVAFADLDNDGFEDMACSGVLYWNNGDGTFSHEGFSFGNSTSFGDFDGDGYIDAVNIQSPPGLWHNNGDRTFTNVSTEMGIVNFDGQKNCAGFGDLDGDGWLDLYVAYSETWSDDSPIYYADRVYRNVDGTSFVDITDDMPSAVSYLKYSRGIHFCDFDVDGDQDLYISRYRLHPNILLVNEGDMDFDEDAVGFGVAGHMVSGAWGHTIGSVWCDFDNDGDFDLICANLAHPRFITFSDKTYIYRNNGDGSFTDVYESSGISYFETHSNPTVGDYDLDGNLDLYISCIYEGYRSFIYRGNGDGSFAPSDYETGVMTENGWGSAWSDFDNDGDLDLFASGNDGLELWRNDEAATFGNHYFKIEALCDITTNNYFARGAQARLYMPDGRILSRCLQGNTGLEGCQDSRIMHFGVGRERFADSLIVTFPGLVNVKIDNPFIVNKKITVFESGLIEGIQETEKPKELTLKAYPNPFNGAVYITHDRKAQVEIYDLSGKKITTIAKDKNRWTPSCDTPAGIYLLKAEVGNATVTSRVLYVK